MCARIETSSAETGSSSTTSRALVERARAMASRCRWPPLNSCGKRRAASGLRPTRSRSSVTRARTSAAPRPSCALTGSAMMSPTRMRGLSELYGSWKTTWTLRRYSCRSAPLRSATLCPSNAMVPAVGSSAASTSFDVVVLPHPDSPTSPSVSPAVIVKLIPSTALTTPRRAAEERTAASGSASGRRAPRAAAHPRAAVSARGNQHLTVPSPFRSSGPGSSSRQRSIAREQRG